MKTITGKIVSSTPIPVSRAASILTRFVANETGASQAIQSYLRCSAAAFDELLRVHSKSDRKRTKKQMLDVEATTTTVSESTRGVEVKSENESESGSAKKSKKEKKEKKEKNEAKEKKKDKKSKKRKSRDEDD